MASPASSSSSHRLVADLLTPQQELLVASPASSSCLSTPHKSEREQSSVSARSENTTTSSTRSRRYRLRVLQQPRNAAAAGTDLQVLDRIPIVPGCVVQLLTELSTGQLAPAEYVPELQYFICFASLVDAQSGQAVEDVNDEATGEDRQPLLGQSVSDLKIVDNLDWSRMSCFVFGDLSVREAGSYRLKFTLAQALPDSPVLCSTTSDIFPVVNHASFVSSPDEASTALSRHLRSQGVSVYLGPIS